MTGVPQAMASVMTRPNGSGQSMGNRTALARRSRSTFSSWEISPITVQSFGMIGLTFRSHSSSSVGCAIFTADTSVSPASFAASMARRHPFSGAARPRNRTKSSLSVLNE